MKSSRDAHLTPSTASRGDYEPHTSNKLSGTSYSPSGKSNIYRKNTKAYTNKDSDLGLNDSFEGPNRRYFVAEIHKLYEKCFLYHKYTASNSGWCLPKADELFKEYYQFEDLHDLKIKLNKVKSQLNNYDIEKWSSHTRRQDPAGEIPRRLKSETRAEFVTVAWCKMYECLGRFPELVKGPQINSLHLCEAPGAFVTALNHYMFTNFDKNEVKWNWLATTLNPYYEGNPVNKMIMDDRFMLFTLDNWLFHRDNTGNIIDIVNLEHMQQQCKSRLKEVHLITADGSIDCMESPDCQEEKVALLLYAEIITALTILTEGGSFIIKMFTMFEASSVSKLFLLTCVFEKVHVFKPCTSKCGNSEVYVVCLNYKKQTENLPEIIDKMKLKLNLENNMLWPLFSKSSLPAMFLTQHEICCRIFMALQKNAIEQNINSYEVRPHKMAVRRLQSLRRAVCNEFYCRFNIRKLPDEFKIVYRFENIMGKSAINKIYQGSHSDRKTFKETSKEEQVFQLRKDLHEVEKVTKEHFQLNEIKSEFEALHNENESKFKIILYRGLEVVSLNSSLFVDIHLFIMRPKINDLFKDITCDCLWLQQPRMEYYNDKSFVSINFNDLTTICDKFCLKQENFFKKIISHLLTDKPNEVKFINMPFLTHYSVSILLFLSRLVYSKLSFSFESKFEIILSVHNSNFAENLEELKIALSSSQDQDILCVLNISALHRNDFNKTLSAFNNMLLLQNYKLILNN